MGEMLTVAFTGANIVPSILMTLVLVYWVLMIIGLLDLHLFHADADIHADADVHVDAHVDAHADVDHHVDAGAGSGGFFQTILVFANADHVPFMIVFSLFVFFMWIIAMALNILPFFDKGGSTIAFLLLPAAIVSVLLTKLITWPMIKMFKEVPFDFDSGAEIVGRTCQLLHDLEPGRLGQAEMTSDGKHMVINVKTDKVSGMQKGETVLVLEKNKQKDFFHVVEFNQ